MLGTGRRRRAAFFFCNAKRDQSRPKNGALEARGLPCFNPFAKADSRGARGGAKRDVGEI